VRDRCRPVHEKPPEQCSLGDAEGVRLLLRMYDAGDYFEHAKVQEANKRRQQWRTGNVSFHVPPVCTEMWDEAAWIAYASSYWAKRGKIGPMAGEDWKGD
jgi:hypothetical protein